MAVLTTRMFYVHEKQIKHTENDDSKHWSPVINLNRHGNARVKGPLNEFIKHKEWACYLLLASRFFFCFSFFSPISDAICPFPLYHKKTGPPLVCIRGTWAMTITYPAFLCSSISVPSCLTWLLYVIYRFHFVLCTFNFATGNKRV